MLLVTLDGLSIPLLAVASVVLALVVLCSRDEGPWVCVRCSTEREEARYFGIIVTATHTNSQEAAECAEAGHMWRPTGRHEKGLLDDYVVGPVSRRIREITAPVTEWIATEYELHGEVVSEMPSDLVEIMNGMPYCWEHMSRSLFIGSPGDFPDPLYMYCWTTYDGWNWWRDSGIETEKVDEYLVRHGYTE